MLKKAPVRPIEVLMHTIFAICGFIAILFVIVITVYLFIAGAPAVQDIGLWDFLTGTVWDSTNKENPLFGILPFILTSVYGALGAIVIGVPIGLLSAVFLSKVAPKRLANALRPVIDLLAGIPSVVYGLVGMLVLVPFIQRTFNLTSGFTMLASVIVLAVMILPSIISVSETSLNAVPKEYEEASLALGATKLETYFRVSIPAAKSGVAASIVLGIGRAIGEAMAIVMVAGNVANMPAPLESVRYLTTAIAAEMSYAEVGSLQRNALFSIGVVLFVFIMLINILLNMFLKKGKEK